MEKIIDTIDWSYQSELNELCKEYNKEWIKMDNFYTKNRIFAYIAGITTLCKGVRQIYAGVNGVFIFDWKDHPVEKKRFDKKIAVMAKKIKAIQIKMGFNDKGLGR